jgi:uncharacterized protein YndB with AHSA1/START domain
METTNKSTNITVSTIINAPMEKVWRLFNDPEHITKWYNASDDWHAPSAESDFKTGGKSRIRMEAKDGSMGFDFDWTYTKIKDHEVIDYIIVDGRKVNIHFENTVKGVKIKVTFEAETENPAELQRGGWQSILDNFKKYVEQN